MLVMNKRDREKRRGENTCKEKETEREQRRGGIMGQPNYGVTGLFIRSCVEPVRCALCMRCSLRVLCAEPARMYRRIIDHTKFWIYIYLCTRMYFFYLLVRVTSTAVLKIALRFCNTG